MDDELRNRFRRASSGQPPLSRRPTMGMPMAPRPMAPSAQPQPMQPHPRPAVQPVEAKPWPKPEPKRPAPLATTPATPNTPPPIAWPEVPKKAEEPDIIELRERPTAKKRRSKAPYAVFASLVLLAGVGAGGYTFWQSKQSQSKQPNAVLSQQSGATSTQTTQASNQTLRIMAVGGTLAFTSINNAANRGDGYNYLPMMQAMKPIFEKADIRLCNQATPSGGVGLGISGTPVFNAPAELAKGLSDTGCNVISLAAHNMNDKEKAGVDATRAAWEALKPLAVAGANTTAEQQAPQYFTVKGTKFALLSYTTTSAKAPNPGFAVNMYSDELAKSQIEAARKEARFVLVSMHWGEDGKSEPNAQQEQIAQFLAAQNADIVFGHGSRTVQTVKVLNGTTNHQTLVWFGLGNFLNSMIPVESLIGGVAIMDVNPSNGQILNPRVLPTYMHYEWSAQERQRQSAADVLARKNFQLVPLETAGDLLAKSQNGTTVQAQQDRLKGLLNKHLKVPLVTIAEL